MANNIEKAGRDTPLTCCKPWRVSKTLTGLSTRSITHQCTFKADLCSSPLCQYRKPIFFVRVMPVQAVEVEEISQNPGTEVTRILETTLTNRHRIRQITIGILLFELAHRAQVELDGKLENHRNILSNTMYYGILQYDGLQYYILCYYNMIWYTITYLITMYLKIEFIFIVRSCDPTSMLHRLGDLADALLFRSFCYLASNQDPGGYEDESPFPNKITDLERFRHAFGCFEYSKTPTILGFLQVPTSPYVEWYQVMAIHGHHWATFEVAQINGRWTSPNRARSGSLGPAQQR